jgi:hypothetical protein
MVFLAMRSLRMRFSVRDGLRQCFARRISINDRRFAICSAIPLISRRRAAAASLPRNPGEQS